MSKLTREKLSLLHNHERLNPTKSILNIFSSIGSRVAFSVAMVISGCVQEHLSDHAPEYVATEKPLNEVNNLNYDGSTVRLKQKILDDTNLGYLDSSVVNN